MIKMNRDIIHNQLAVAAEIATRGLKTDELVSLNLVASSGLDPHDRLFDYEAVKHLFTEGEGTKCHAAVREAISLATMKRLLKEEKS